jgi:hypothetical protein
MGQYHDMAGQRLTAVDRPAAAQRVHDEREDPGLVAQRVAARRLAM